MKYLKSFLIGIFCFVAGFLFYFIIQKQYNIQSIYNHQYDIESFETDTSPTLDPSASLIACSLIDETQIIQNVNNFLPFIDVINNGSNKKNNPKKKQVLEAIPVYFGMIDNMSAFLSPCPTSTDSSGATVNTLNVKVLTDVMNNRLTADPNEIMNAYNKLSDKTSKLNQVLQIIQSCLKPLPNSPPVIPYQ
jgi:hypothetical protein